MLRQRVNTIVGVAFLATIAMAACIMIINAGTPDVGNLVSGVPAEF